MTKMEQLGIAEWPVAEKLALLGELWESLPEVVGPSDVPAWHLEEIDRRRADADANPGAGRPWREVLAELEAAG